jgi:hypothetical protein
LANRTTKSPPKRKVMLCLVILAGLLWAGVFVAQKLGNGDLWALIALPGIFLAIFRESGEMVASIPKLPAWADTYDSLMTAVSALCLVVYVVVDWWSWGAAIAFTAVAVAYWRQTPISTIDKIRRPAG